jgi:Spy/CpxP family protein refolding chaperone
MLFVQAMVQHSQAVLVPLGLSADDAKAAGTEIARQLATDFGKERLYIPSTLHWDTLERDVAVYEAYSKPGPDDARAFTQHRLEQVAKQHDITAHYAATIVRLVQAQRHRDRQGELPGLEIAQ